jgi:hypothetical protein
MTRLYGTLPTLEGAISDANQGSLPVDGQSFPGGLVPAGSHQWLSGARYFLCRFSFRFSSSLGYERHPRLTGLGWRQKIYPTEPCVPQQAALQKAAAGCSSPRKDSVLPL